MVMQLLLSLKKAGVEQTGWTLGQLSCPTVRLAEHGDALATGDEIHLDSFVSHPTKGLKVQSDGRNDGTGDSVSPRRVRRLNSMW